MDLQSFLQRACPRVVLPLRFEVHFGTPKIRQKSTQNGTNNGPKSIPERPGDTLAHPWGAVVHLGGLRVAFWLHFGTVLGRLRGHLGPCGAIFGPGWVHLASFGDLLCTFRGIWGQFWDPLGPSGFIFGPFWHHLGPFARYRGAFKRKTRFSQNSS